MSGIYVAKDWVQLRPPVNSAVNPGTSLKAWELSDD
jgi:hypothetical protein